MSSETEFNDQAAPLITKGRNNKQWTSTGALNYGSSNGTAKKTLSFGSFRDQQEEISNAKELKTIRNNAVLDGRNLSIKSISDENDWDDNASRCSLVFGDFDNISITWLNVLVDVPNHNDNVCKRIMNTGKRYKPLRRKQILKSVSGAALPGRVLAIMGASGAGKTTLLNVLTQRNVKGLTIDGEIKVNGQEIGKGIRSISAYVQQDDLFIGTLKVKEHIQFQAELRLGDSFTKRQKEERVHQVLIELGLYKCANTVIGVKGQTKGISGGERKRLAFASEVLTNPSVMFCDEPTSGLDSFMAQQVVAVLKDMAKKGKTIICTIHQPSSQVFQYFDDLCLLAEGRVAYMGPSKYVAGLFEKAHFPCPKNFNPADHYIRTLAMVPGKEIECKKRIKQICYTYRDSEMAAKIHETANQSYVDDDEISMFDDEKRSSQIKYKANWFTQFKALFWRSSIQNIREPMLIQIRLWETIVISILLGLVYYKTDITGKTIQNINGILFMFVMNMTFQFLFAVVHVFCEEYPVFLREHFSHMYRVDAYYIAKTLSELPQYLLFPAIFTAILYFMAGLTPDPKVFFSCLGINILTANVAVSLGYVASTFFTDLNLAMSVTPILVIPFMLFGGFYINSDSVPVYFIWFQYLSYMKYSYEAISINQWQSVGDIPGCSNFTCPSNGTAVLQTLNFDPNLFDLDVTILCIMFIVLRLISFSALLIRTYVQND